MNLFHQYEALLAEKKMPCVDTLAHGLAQQEVREKLQDLFPSLFIDDSFCAFYEWHNGNIDDSYPDNYLHKIIIPEYCLVALDEAVSLINDDDIYAWKKNRCIPILTVGDEHLCIQAYNGRLNATDCPILYYATWDGDYHAGMQKYDSLHSLFQTNLRGLNQGIIYKDESGFMSIENTMDEFWTIGRKYNPRSKYWKS